MYESTCTHSLLAYLSAPFPFFANSFFTDFVLPKCKCPWESRRTFFSVRVACVCWERERMILSTCMHDFSIHEVKLRVIPTGYGSEKILCQRLNNEQGFPPCGQLGISHLFGWAAIISYCIHCLHRGKCGCGRKGRQTFHWGELQPRGLCQGNVSCVLTAAKHCMRAQGVQYQYHMTILFII